MNTDLAAISLRTSKGILTQLKEAGGFWLPNSIIDTHSTVLGSRGVFLYTILARQVTQTQYPSLRHLSEMTQMSAPLVSKLLRVLRGLGLLNDSDLGAILGYVPVEPEANDAISNMC